MAQLDADGPTGHTIDGVSGAARALAAERGHPDGMAEPRDDRWIDGFSKLDKPARRAWIDGAFAQTRGGLRELYASFDHGDAAVQAALDGFAENTVANFALPLGIAPNFIVDGRTYAVPMAVEESSVVAAASAAAKYWGRRGGFRTTVLGMEKVGQLFFTWGGSGGELRGALPRIERALRAASAEHTANMERRGGGVLGVELVRYEELPHHFELRGRFDTRDSMGANLINTVLECWGVALPGVLAQALPEATVERGAPEVTMAILSNYTPECVVRAEVTCRIAEMGPGAGDFSSAEVASRFERAVRLARVSPYRATTHNKGILNGIDAVVIATGNDFRAVEACAHAYAARDGRYRSLSHCTLEGDEFRFWLEVPLALGTVGGLTGAHPLAAANLALLGEPSAEELMRIVAAAGLAQNFAAVRSLVTTGIQDGHMRMHLGNILRQLDATPEQARAAEAHFAQRTVSVAGVRSWLRSGGA